MRVNLILYQINHVRVHFIQCHCFISNSNIYISFRDTRIVLNEAIDSNKTFAFLFHDSHLLAQKMWIVKKPRILLLSIFSKMFYQVPIVASINPSFKNFLNSLFWRNISFTGYLPHTFNHFPNQIHRWDVKFIISQINFTILKIEIDEINSTFCK